MIDFDIINNSQSRLTPEALTYQIGSTLGMAGVAVPSYFIIKPYVNIHKNQSVTKETLQATDKLASELRDALEKEGVALFSTYGGEHAFNSFTSDSGLKGIIERIRKVKSNMVPGAFYVNLDLPLHQKQINKALKELDKLENFYNNTLRSFSNLNHPVSETEINNFLDTLKKHKKSLDTLAELETLMRGIRESKYVEKYKQLPENNIKLNDLYATLRRATENKSEEEFFKYLDKFENIVPHPYTSSHPYTEYSLADIKAIKDMLKSKQPFIRLDKEILSAHPEAMLHELGHHLNFQDLKRMKLLSAYGVLRTIAPTMALVPSAIYGSLYTPARLLGLDDVTETFEQTFPYIEPLAYAGAGGMGLVTLEELLASYRGAKKYKSMLEQAINNVKSKTQYLPEAFKKIKTRKAFMGVPTYLGAALIPAFAAYAMSHTGEE